MSNPVLDALRTNREKLVAATGTLLAKVEAEGRDLTTKEIAEFNRQRAAITDIDARLEEETSKAARLDMSLRNAIPVGAGAANSNYIRSEPMTYAKHGQNSYILDLARIAIEGKGASVGDGADEARQRMGQHLKEVSVEMRSSKKMSRTLIASGFVREGQEVRVNPSNIAGQGGEFLPPLWLTSSYVKYVRAGRVCANRCVNNPLPPGIDVINVPKLTVGSTTAIQQAQGAAVSSTDIQTSAVAASVNTIAGQEDISLQLLEQSPIAMDGVVFEDLTSSYDQQLDQQVLFGSGVGGQHLGVLSVSSATSNTNILKANNVSCTSTQFFDGTTGSTFYRSLVNAVTQIETLRFESPTAIWVHPRRANAFAFAADSTTAGSGRPLYQKVSYGLYNSLGEMSPAPVAQGVAGELFGLPVVKDANVPTNMSGTTVGTGAQDVAIIVKEDDLILWEGQLKLRALPEILSGTLQIRMQCYAYSAFQAQRFPPSISTVTGAGMASPTY